MSEDQNKKIVNWALFKEKTVFILKYVKWPLTVVIAAFLISPRFWSYWENHHYNASLVLDYINALKWPIIALIILWVLKPHIPDLISRMKRARGPGVDFEFSPPPGQQSISEESKEEIRELQGEGDQPATTQNTDSIEDLLTSPEAKLAFEQVYGIIFGSQILIMKRLADHIPEGLALEDFTDIYNDHQKSSPNPYHSIIGLLQFIIDNSLVLYDISDKKYKLTYAGLYFLRYLQETGRYYIQKPY